MSGGAFAVYRALLGRDGVLKAGRPRPTPLGPQLVAARIEGDMALEPNCQE